MPPSTANCRCFWPAKLPTPCCCSGSPHGRGICASRNGRATGYPRFRTPSAGARGPTIAPHMPPTANHGLDRAPLRGGPRDRPRGGTFPQCRRLSVQLRLLACARRRTLAGRPGRDFRACPVDPAQQTAAPQARPAPPGIGKRGRPKAAIKARRHRAEFERVRQGAMRLDELIRASEAILVALVQVAEKDQVPLRAAPQARTRNDGSIFCNALFIPPSSVTIRSA